MRLIKLVIGLVLLAMVCACCSDQAQAELLEFDDASDSMIAATYVSSTNATGWNDPTLYAGDFFGFHYHIYIAIKDTSALQSLFTDYVLDSAALSVVIGTVAGSPGSLNVHFIRRDSTGTGIYPAYDDSRSYYCRSEWYGRKSALPYACPDSILWETPGATGPSDYNPVPFADLPTPVAGSRFDIDVTSWIAGIVTGTDSTSNGIMLLSANEDGAGTDYITIRHIHPFYAGTDRMILRIWRSEPVEPPLRRAWLDTPDALK